MIKIDFARNYDDYAAGNFVTAEMPQMPTGEFNTIIFSDENFQKLKEENNDLNSFRIREVFYIEEFERPFIELIQDKEE